MNVTAYRFRQLAKTLFRNFSDRLGRRILDSGAFLEKYPATRMEPSGEELDFDAPAAELIAAGCAPAPELAGGRTRYTATGVYRLSPADFPALKVLSNGAVQVDGETIVASGLGPERGSQVAALVPDFRRARSEKYVIAPFPHRWKVGTYGDFLLRVLPRICRVVEKMDPAHRAHAVIAYPLFHGGYEQALLGRLGFTAEQLVDTRHVRVECAQDGMVYCPNGEPAGWSGKGSHPEDYQAVRRTLGIGLAKPAGEGADGRRIYLRRTGRRRMLNEGEILPLLRGHGFEEIDPAGLSCDAQIKVCEEAAVVLGMHGANLSNLLWCAPGTTIVELFGRGFRPAFYRMMALGLGLQYRYWAETPMAANDFANVNWDVSCDAAALRNYLEASWR